ncbi:MAG: alkaline phosphatase family protein [Chloroflexota bacterium]|nr:alkaline phosphatase family protein [Chloroflexota bacterium]
MTRVILVMIDGLRPDALDPTRTPNLLRAQANGASTLTAQSVMPSITLPCHMSIFHSVPPARHGITSNYFTPMARPVIGLFDVANDAGKRCAFVYNWEELRDISRPGALDFSVCVRNSYDLENGDQMMATHALPLIQHVDHDFVFVYLGTVDTAGHFYSWMSEGYLAQVARIDAVFGQLYDALPADAVMIVHADHGGHDRYHGTDVPEDMTIPYIIVGTGIKPGYAIQRPVSLLDTAPTIARLLNVPIPRDWEGTPIDEAFLT